MCIGGVGVALAPCATLLGRRVRALVVLNWWRVFRRAAAARMGAGEESPSSSRQGSHPAFSSSFAPPGLLIDMPAPPFDDQLPCQTVTGLRVAATAAVCTATALSGSTHDRSGPQPSRGGTVATPWQSHSR